MMQAKVQANAVYRHDKEGAKPLIFPSEQLSLHSKSFDVRAALSDRHVAALSALQTPKLRFWDLCPRPSCLLRYQSAHCHIV